MVPRSPFCVWPMAARSDRASDWQGQKQWLRRVFNRQGVGLPGSDGIVLVFAILDPSPTDRSDSAVSVTTRIDPGQEFAFANLHGRWSGFLRGDELRRLVQAASPDLLLRALAGRGIQIAALPEARRELVRHLGNDLARVMAMLDDGTAAFCEAFLRRFWYEDLKTILHARVLGMKEMASADLLVDLPMLPPLPVAFLLAARTGEEFAGVLPPGDRGVAGIVDDLATGGDIPRADSALDCRFYGGLQAAARRCPWQSRQLAGELVGIEIDTANIITLLRNRRTYRLPPAEVLALCIPGGPATPMRTLERLAVATTPGEAAALLPRRLADCLHGRQLDDLSQIEADLRQMLHHQARRGFRDYERPGCTGVAYPYLKWTEIINMGRLCEGMRFGLLPAELSPLLIGENARV